MRTALNGLATSIPQLTQIYMYSLQHNLNVAQEERLQTESDKRIEQINLEMLQAEKIFPQKLEELQTNIDESKAGIDARNATTAYYKAAEIGANWDNLNQVQQWKNSMRAKELREDILLKMERFSKTRNPSEQQILENSKAMEHAATELRLLAGDVGFLTREDTMRNQSAETMLVLAGAFTSSDPKANAAYTTLLADPNTSMTEVTKFLRENNVFQDNAIKLAFDVLDKVEKENAEAFGTFVTNAFKDAGLSERPATDSTFLKDDELKYSRLKDDEIESQRDIRYRERDNVIYELARRGIPELSVPPMFKTDSAGRLYDDLFYRLWYLWLSPIGTKEWEDNHPDVLKQNEVNRMKSEIFEDGKYLDEQYKKQRTPASASRTDIYNF